jgi:hypothetical protein
MVAALAMTAFAVVAQAQFKPAPPAVNPNGPPVQIIPSAQQPQLQPQVESSLDSARRIPRDEAMKMVKAHKAVYIDVRAKDQFDLAHIPEAINIPLSELPTRWKDLPPGKFLITYCA